MKNRAITFAGRNFEKILTIGFLAALLGVFGLSQYMNWKIRNYYGRHNSTSQMLQNIHSAQAVYESGIGNGNYASNLAVLGGGTASTEVGLIDSTIVNAQTTAKSGYLLGELKTVPRTATSPARYSITAFPVGGTGKDCYYIDETGIIRHSGRPDVPATPSSPPLEEKK